MQIPDKQLVKFQQLWKKRFNEEITKEKALEEGTKLINLVKVVYRPITKKQCLEYKEESRDKQNYDRQTK